MNPRIVCIVEGHGEVEALPVLIRRIAAGLKCYNIDVPRPIRCPKSKIVRAGSAVEPGELGRAVQLAVAKLEGRKNGAVFILLDADDDCPATLGPELLAAAKNIRSDVRVSAVLAKQEYEAWFIASIESLKRKGKLPPEAEPHSDPESISDAKGYLSRQMGHGRTYSEPVDQPALSHEFDFDEALRCRSFRKCRREIMDLLRYVTRCDTQGG